MPLACFQKHFQTNLISFLVLKHHLHLSLHGKKNRLALCTLLVKTSGSPWRRRSTPLSCSMHLVSKYLSMWMGFLTLQFMESWLNSLAVPRLLKVKSWFWMQLHGTIIGTIICIFINANKTVYSVYLKSYCVNADTKAGRGTKPNQIFFPSAAFYGLYNKMWSFIVAQRTWRTWVVSAAFQ